MNRAAGIVGIGVTGLFTGVVGGLTAPPVGLVAAAYLAGGCLGGMVADGISSELKNEDFNLADAGGSCAFGVVSAGGIGKLFGK